MKIYTGTGDEGTTGLYGGGRVSKHHPRIEAYGTVDELNASIGLAVASESDRRTWGDISDVLLRVQKELFEMGADLATPLDSRAEVPRISEALIRQLEEDIDSFQSTLEPLESFVLPGGSTAASALHIARTICRRAERRVVALADAEDVNSLTAVYLNRLADLLFVLARAANRASGVSDVKWSAR